MVGSPSKRERPFLTFQHRAEEHIPDMSSPVEFFDLLYLGVFVVLSLAYDDRSYDRDKPPPPRLLKESAYAIAHFHSVLHQFYRRFILVLEGEPVSVSYVFHRMLAEFAAASVVLARAIYESEGYESDEEVEDRVSSLALEGQIKIILQTSYPEVLPYFVRCLDRGNRDFVWTGADVQILPRSATNSLLISLATKGEHLDLPSHRIYSEDIDSNPPNLPETTSPVGTRRSREDSLSLEEGRAKKRSRRS